MGQRGIDGRFIGHALRQMDPKDRQRKVALTLAMCDGNVKRAAHYLGVHRVTMYKLIKEHGLYPIVNAARRRRRDDADKDRRLKKYGVQTDPTR